MWQLSASVGARPTPRCRLQYTCTEQLVGYGRFAYRLGVVWCVFADTHTSYAMVRSGFECNSTDDELGSFTSVQQCADKCQVTSGCRFFKYNSVTGECGHEEAVSTRCSEGWTKSASNDFYEYRGDSRAHLQD